LHWLPRTDVEEVGDDLPILPVVAGADGFIAICPAHQDLELNYHED
jgi:hypothetical protein